MKLDALIKASESRAVQREKRVAKIPEKKILKPKEGVRMLKRQAEIKRQAVEDLTSIAEKAKSKFKEEQEFKKLLEAQQKMSIKDKNAIRRKSEVDFKKLLEAQQKMEEKEKQDFEKIRLATEKQRVKEEEKTRRASQELKLKKELEQKEDKSKKEKEKQEREKEKERQSTEDEKARNKALNPKEKAKTKEQLVTEAVLIGIPKKEAEKMKKGPLEELVKTEYIKAMKDKQAEEKVINPLLVPSKLKQRVDESRDSRLAKAKDDMKKSREYLRKSRELQAEEARSYYGLQAEEPPDTLALAFTNWDFQGALNGYLDDTSIKEVVDRAKNEGIIIDPAQVARFLPRDMVVALIKKKGIDGLDKGLRDYIISRDGTVNDEINTKLYNQIKDSAPLNVSPAIPIRASIVLE